jgi:hypothetical protein
VTVIGTKKDAERKLTELLAQRDNGQLVAPSKLLLRDFLEGWLEGWCTTNLSPTSRERYEQVVHKQIIPFFADVKLQDLKPAHISRWYAQLLEKWTQARGALQSGYGPAGGSESSIAPWQSPCRMSFSSTTRVQSGVRPGSSGRRFKSCRSEDVTRLLQIFRGRKSANLRDDGARHRT